MKVLIEVVAHAGADGCRGFTAAHVGGLVENLQSDLQCGGNLPRYHHGHEAKIL